MTAEYQKIWRDKRLAQGRCARCGCPREDKSKTKCNSCLKMYRDQAKRWAVKNFKSWYQKNKSEQQNKGVTRMRKLRAKGLCVRCGKIPSKTYNCESCRDQIFMLRKQRKLSSVQLNQRRAYRRKYQRNKLKTDPVFKLQRVLRSRLWTALKRKYKTGSAVRDLGCSLEFFRGFIEAKFLPGMSWANHGSVWHIDHVIPLSSVNIEDRTQLLSVLHYTNLQPLWKEDNLRKSDKVINLRSVS